MRHARVPIGLLLLAAVTLPGCGEENRAGAGADVPRPVKTRVVEAPGGVAERTFPGRVEAANRATLSFQVAGELSEILVKEGERVESGQVLARLDPTDFQVVVNDREATFKRAKADFERAGSLVEKGFVSRADFDRLEATYRQAEAGLEQARNDLRYTELKAPFAGTVSKRLVENFEQVSAKQEVLELRDLDTLEIKFDVPERMVQRLRRREPEHAAERSAGRLHAGFEGLPDRRFELTFKEAATQADSQTQTFEISATMPRPRELQVLPGMTASVTVNLAGLVSGEETRYLVPAAAVVANSGLAPRVWLVDPETLTLESRAVKVGKLAGREIEVLEGIEPGDRIVVAGAAYMVEGMKVSLLPASEQAEPRLDDPGPTDTRPPSDTAE